MPFSGLGSGTPQDPYQVATAAQFLEVANDLAAHYIQTADIAILATHSGNFSGSYDGQGYKLDVNSACPIFYSISGTVRRMHLTGSIADSTTATLCSLLLSGANVSNIRSDVIVTGAVEISGLVLTYVGGTVESCLVLGELITEEGGDVQGTGIFYTGNKNYWDKTVNPGLSGEDTYGLTTEQLKSGELPEGFDPEIWRAEEGEYPRLYKDPKTLTVTSGSGGSASPETKNWDIDEVVSIAATPETGYRFVAWSGTAVEAGKVKDPLNSTTTVVMDDDYTLVAGFAPAVSEPTGHIEEAFYAILTGDVTLANIIGTRAYMGTSPQGTELPHVTWTLISDVPEYHAEGMCGLSRARVQLDCWAASFSECRRLQNAAVAAISGIAERIEGVKIHAVLVTNITDASVFPEDTQIKKTYGRTIEMDIWYDNNLGV